MDDLLEELEGLDHGSWAGKQHLQVVLHHRRATYTEVTLALKVTLPTNCLTCLTWGMMQVILGDTRFQVYKVLLSLDYRPGVHVPAAAVEGLTGCWRGVRWQKVGRCWSSFWSRASWSGAGGSCCSLWSGPGPRGLHGGAGRWCVWTAWCADSSHAAAGRSGGSWLQTRQVKNAQVSDQMI